MTDKVTVDAASLKIKSLINMSDQFQLLTFMNTYWLQQIVLPYSNDFDCLKLNDNLLNFSLVTKFFIMNLLYR